MCNNLIINMEGYTKVSDINNKVNGQFNMQDSDVTIQAQPNDNTNTITIRKIGMLSSAKFFIIKFSHENYEINIYEHLHSFNQLLINAQNEHNFITILEIIMENKKSCDNEFQNKQYLYFVFKPNPKNTLKCDSTCEGNFYLLRHLDNDRIKIMKSYEKFINRNDLLEDLISFVLDIIDG